MISARSCGAAAARPHVVACRVTVIDSFSHFEFLVPRALETVLADKIRDFFYAIAHVNLSSKTRDDKKPKRHTIKIVFSDADNSCKEQEQQPKC